MELPAIFWIRYFIFASTVFGVSSILIYGSIFQTLRSWWFKHAGIFEDLFRCQLCISVWIAFALQWLILDYTDPFMYFFLSCSVAGISWSTGAFTQCALWGKAYFEKRVNNVK